MLLNASGVHADEPAPDLEVFVRAGCPHRKAAKHFLDELQRERPSLNVVFHDVALDPTALQRLKTLAAERGIANVGVPTFRIGQEVVIGFLSAETTGAQIRAGLDKRTQDDKTARGTEGIKPFR